MRNQPKKKHNLADEPLGNEEQNENDPPKSFEDKRPADLEILKGDHVDTDTSRNPSDWEKEKNPR